MCFVCVGIHFLVTRDAVFTCCVLMCDCRWISLVLSALLVITSTSDKSAQFYHLLVQDYGMEKAFTLIEQ